MVPSITPIHLEHFPWYDYRRYSFSLGLKTSAGTYLSGHTASQYEPETRRIIVRGGMSEQVRTIYAKVAAILEGGGLGYGDIVRIVEYVRHKDLDRYAEAAAVRQELLGKHEPVVNTVPVKSLLRPEACIEIEVTAAASRSAAPGAVFLPSIQPVDDQGRVIGNDNFLAQIHAVYDRAERILSALGLGLDHVVKTASYITSSALDEHENIARVRQERLGPVYPTAVEIVMPRLLHPQALIQCDLIATQETPMAVNHGWTRYDKLGCSPAVRAGKLVYMSGQGGSDQALGSDDGDVVAQAERSYRNILHLLHAAGGTPHHLVKTIEYVTPASLERYREVSGVRSRMLQEPLPASTGLVSEALLHPGMRIDVDALGILD